MSMNWGLGLPAESKIKKIRHDNTQPGIIKEYGCKLDDTIIKTTIFIDTNKNRKVDDSDKLYSVEYSDGSMSPFKTEYIDEDGDGNYDKVIYRTPFGTSETTEAELKAKDRELRKGADRRSMKAIYVSPDADGPLVAN